MSEHIRATIKDLQQQLTKQDAEVADTKRLINMLCRRAGMAPLFPNGEDGKNGGTVSLRRDQFYGQPLATCIRSYLELRRAAGQGPATVNEIYDALVEGGFKFETKSTDNAKRGLRISLAKNRAIFHRLPDGKSYGLRSWYPAVKGPKVQELEPEELEEQDKDEEKPNSSAVSALERSAKARVTEA